MSDFFDPARLHAWLMHGESWVRDHVLVRSTLVQAIVIVACLGLAWAVSSIIKHKHRDLVEKRWGPLVPGTIPNITNRLIPQLSWLVLMGLCLYVAARSGWPRELLRISVSLLLAWVVIRFVATLVRNPPVARTVALVAWTIAALNIVHLLKPVMQLLDGIAVNVGAFKLSLLVLIKGVLFLVISLWIANLISEFVEGRLRRSVTLTPSYTELMVKLIRIGLITIAFMLAISTVGIDLTVFAVFGGALGVGLGFGLQKVVSNFVSGIILLLDKSIKPGDVISVGETYGWVKSLNARYVSLDTRDGIEHLIPNEELIVTRVENWSYSHNRIRMHIPVGIHYKSDVHKAIRLCTEAAYENERILKEPECVCLLREFGDSSVNLEVRAWIDDPRAGISNVKSDVLLKIWDKFHENGIEIPFPQRDIHIKTPINLGSRDDQDVK